VNDVPSYEDKLILEGYEREAVLVRRCDILRIALQTIANGDSGMWGRIALEALDKERKP